ncbi:hypothetical protein DFH06DRAFT_61307 [Mycena polygramma]|nr:hypothetical protein DFH06DRAFT_61307 [Mycena polygramma]
MHPHLTSRRHRTTSSARRPRRGSGSPATAALVRHSVFLKAWIQTRGFRLRWASRTDGRSSRTHTSLPLSTWRCLICALYSCRRFSHDYDSRGDGGHIYGMRSGARRVSRGPLPLNALPRSALEPAIRARRRWRWSWRRWSFACAFGRIYLHLFLDAGLDRHWLLHPERSFAMRTGSTRRWSSPPAMEHHSVGRPEGGIWRGEEERSVRVCTVVGVCPSRIFVHETQRGWIHQLRVRGRNGPRRRRRSESRASSRARRRCGRGRGYAAAPQTMRSRG